MRWRRSCPEGPGLSDRVDSRCVDKCTRGPGLLKCERQLWAPEAQKRDLRHPAGCSLPQGEGFCYRPTGSGARPVQIWTHKPENGRQKPVSPVNSQGKMLLFVELDLQTNRSGLFSKPFPNPQVCESICAITRPVLRSIVDHCAWGWGQCSRIWVPSRTNSPRISRQRL